MASDDPTTTSLQRLADQLELLSQLTESLTYRLLDLEERLQGHEQQWQERLLASEPSLPGEELEWRLLETEDRLAGIESLLRRIDQGRELEQGRELGRSASWQAAGSGSDQAARPVGRAVSTDRDGTTLRDPFPDDGEQMFSDEQAA